jgi:DNA repair protein RadC
LFCPKDKTFAKIKKCVSMKNSVVHPREIFYDALTDRTAGIIFVHNHPENDVEPSEQDKEITKQLIEAGKLLIIEVIDHIIVAKNDYFSFQENGMI